MFCSLYNTLWCLCTLYFVSLCIGKMLSTIIVSIVAYFAPNCAESSSENVTSFLFH
uniref:Uncharacterized protein n=1 Tax=Ciona intestinalis TaxID=7719 RepID=H2XP41_CIOIN